MLLIALNNRTSAWNLYIFSFNILNLFTFIEENTYCYLSLSPNNNKQVHEQDKLRLNEYSNLIINTVPGAS